MENAGIRPDVQTYNSIVDTIARNGKHPGQAEAMLDRMSEAGVRPDVVIYNSVVNGTFDFEQFINLDVFGAAHISNVLSFVFCSLGKVASSRRSRSRSFYIKWYGRERTVAQCPNI